MLICTSFLNHGSMIYLSKTQIRWWAPITLDPGGLFLLDWTLHRGQDFFGPENSGESTPKSFSSWIWWSISILVKQSEEPHKSTKMKRFPMRFWAPLTFQSFDTWERPWSRSLLLCTTGAISTVLCCFALHTAVVSSGDASAKVFTSWAPRLWAALALPRSSSPPQPPPPSLHANVKCIWGRSAAIGIIYHYLGSNPPWSNHTTYYK